MDKTEAELFLDSLLRKRSAMFLGELPPTEKYDLKHMNDSNFLEHLVMRIQRIESVLKIGV